MPPVNQMPGPFARAFAKRIRHRFRHVALRRRRPGCATSSVDFSTVASVEASGISSSTYPSSAGCLDLIAAAPPRRWSPIAATAASARAG